MAIVTTYPPLPAHVVDTFEGMLLSRFAEFRSMPGGLVAVTSDEDYDTNDITMQQDEYDLFFAKAQESTSDLATDLVDGLEHFLSYRVANDQETTIEELAEVVGRSGIQLEDVIHALCQRFPAEIPYVEVQWASTDKRLVHGNFCGGASVITPEGVQTMSTRTWLEEKRAQLAPTIDPEASFGR
jgi:hypothetical protein